MLIISKLIDLKLITKAVARGNREVGLTMFALMLVEISTAKPPLGRPPRRLGSASKEYVEKPFRTRLSLAQVSCNNMMSCLIMKS